MKTIGILAFQGGVAEHREKIEAVGAKVREILQPKDLSGLDGLILPGGESTCIIRMLSAFHLVQPLANLLKEGLPTWGTCAGAILLSKEVDGKLSTLPLGIVNIGVQRNAYGAQLDSFITEVCVPNICSGNMRLIFVRAPRLVSLENSVTPLITIMKNNQQEIVAVRENHFLVTMFHPELDIDTSFHNYFLKEFC